MYQRKTIVVAIVLLIVGGMWGGWDFFDKPFQSASEATRLIRLATARDAAAAWQQAQVALVEFPDHLGVASAAAEAAAAADEFQGVLTIVSGRDDRTFFAGNLTVQALSSRGHHRLAMSLLDARIAGDPGDFSALVARGELLLKQGRLSAARKDFRGLLQQGSVPLEDLVFLCSRRECLEDIAGLELALQVDSSYAPTYVGLGTHAAFEGRFDEAENYLKKAVDLDGQLADAWAALGLLYYQQGEVAGHLTSWQQQVHDKEIRHADISFVLAWLADQANESEKAMAFLLTGLQDSPLHRACNQLLSATLARQPEGKSAAEFLARRAGLIHDLEVHMHEVLFGDRSPEAFKRAAELCGKLGASDLAIAWAGGLGPELDQSFVDSINATSKAANQELQSILTQWQRDPADEISFKMDPTIAGVAQEESDSAQSQFQLADVAAEVGLPSTYYGGFDNFDSGLWVYQGFGGGVAVLDFDNDDTPDLFFTQASKWGSNDSLPLEQQDLLCRSRGGQFRLVNKFALQAEHDFGQGAAIGDVNRDGFDDIYVTNIEANELLVNNGDGTFQTVEMEHTDEADWTTSCLLADIDNDGLDDIYDVQYLKGTEPFERICRSGPEQLVRSCLPSLFEPASDRVLRNRGDGSFDDQSMSSGLADLKGRGLGIVAANLDGDSGLEIFVSNDMTANHYLQVEAENGNLKFQEQGELQGLARNGEGQLEACMGIALADVSGDGQLDLFVTNFFEETNTYYESLSNGFFRDQTVVARLGTVSRKKLGFGTQAMDIDLDGDWDFLIANGHVDDYSHVGAPWKMNVDLMENNGNSQFRRRPDHESGVYGAMATLGRSVARLDWNRDGLPDAVVTHLDRGPALLANNTELHGDFVSVRLVGTQSNRPAIGTVVIARFNDSQLTIQQIAGDGYYCSNERRIMFGVGDAKMLTEVEVRWPSGTTTRFSDVQVGTRYVAVEGRRTMYTLTP